MSQTSSHELQRDLTVYEIAPVSSITPSARFALSFDGLIGNITSTAIPWSA
jgi:hypothetical protein